MALRLILGADIPPNEGLYRPIHVAIPEGTILNPRYPAAISAATQVSYHTVEALMHALAPLAPSTVIGDSGCGGVFSFGGLNPRTGHLYAYGGAIGGGLGAGAFGDGESAVMPPVSNTRNTPVESLEMALPIRLERYELVEGSGGAGKYRGGLGIRHVFRMLAPATCSFQVAMSRKPPSGLEGGHPGAPTQITITSPNGQVTVINTFTTYEAHANDLITIETAGGGGFGSPRERASDLVQADLLNGYVPGEGGEASDGR